MIKIIITILFALITNSLAYGQTLIRPQGDFKKVNIVKEIKFDGLNKTASYVVYRELLIKVGDEFIEGRLTESLRRLRNLRLFTEVDAKISEGEKGISITISLIEKWTTIPIARFGGGGGTAFYILGVYDIHTFGRYLELGGQYENFGGRDSGVVWFRDPRFLNQQLLLGLELWSIIRNQETRDETGELAGAYILSRRRINSFAEYEINLFHTIGLGVQWDDDQLGESTIEPWLDDLNDQNKFLLEEQYQTITLRLNYQAGQLNYEDYLVSGTKNELEFGWTQGWSNQLSRRVYVNWTGQHFWRWGKRQNLGINIKVGATDARIIEQHYFLGGLGEIRGYANNQFIGPWYWQTNLEYRFSSYHSTWFALQHVLFADAIKIANSGSNLLGSTPGPYYSIGTGIRLISPRVYRFVFRLDLAKTIGPIDNFGVAFGVQQFF